MEQSPAHLQQQDAAHAVNAQSPCCSCHQQAWMMAGGVFNAGPCCLQVMPEGLVRSTACCYCLTLLLDTWAIS
jgi:hypothetical protein